MAAAVAVADEPCHRGARVNLPAAPRPFGEALRSALKDTFFPDDPFRGLGGLPPRRRAWRVARYFVPAMDWAAGYSAGSFWCDLLAGVTIASLSIPQGISYATLAGIPPIIGLYSCFVPPLVYAVLGSSKNLGVGPVATSSLLVASIIGGKVKASDDLQLYTQLVFTSAFFTGVLQAALGFLRLGIVVDFMSRPAITGFMGGTAMVIMLQQLKGLLGMKHFTTNTDVVSVLRYVFHNKHQWQWQSTVLGVCFLIFLVLTEQVRRRRPKLFWISAMSPLLVVIVGCVFSFLIKGYNHGIPVVGTLKRGINPSSISQLKFQSEYVGVAMKAGFVSGVLALAEGVAVGRTQELRGDEERAHRRQQGDGRFRAHEPHRLLHLLLHHHRGVLEDGSERPRRVPDGDVERGDVGVHGAGAAGAGAAVPVHAAGGAGGHHHQLHAGSGQAPGDPAPVQGGQGRLRCLRRGAPGRRLLYHDHRPGRRGGHLRAEGAASRGAAGDEQARPRVRHRRLLRRGAVPQRGDRAQRPRPAGRLADLLRQRRVPPGEDREVGGGREEDRRRPRRGPALPRPRHRRRDGDRQPGDRDAEGGARAAGDEGDDDVGDEPEVGGGGEAGAVGLCRARRRELDVPLQRRRHRRLPAHAPGPGLPARSDR